MSLREQVRGLIEEALVNLLFRSVLQKAGGGAGAPLDHRAGGWPGSDPVPGVGLELPGLAFAPQQGEPCFVLGVGPVRLILALSSARFRPAVPPGGVTLYTLVKGAKQARVQLKPDDGAVAVDAGAGADVVVNGGTKAVSRVGDKVAIDTQMAAWMKAVAIGLSGLGVPGIAQQVNDFGVIAEGAAHFKG